ncbi:head decoration protein [Streptomyces sp. BE133]|uniref:head decoration protein n=1 Tax=Streptomyces sp. BE133 TaxID=3002523 RepID=UPI002E76FDD2|nr:head decoration protein [Streptomyces sp. BE133]MEE1812720.1 head decoration protein [Streptomyces sp. BE133]
MDIQPMTTTETVTADRRWLRNLHGSGMNATITLDVTKFTSGTHYLPATARTPQAVFKSGLPLGKITASGLYAPYASGATDGTEVLVGLLATDTHFNPAVTKVGGALLVHGDVETAKLPVALTVPAAASRTDNIHFS